MMFLLQLVLCVMSSMSSFCSGMDKQEFAIGLVSDASYTDTKIKKGILEIYYDKTKDYRKCARFISGKEIITFTNFNQEHKDFLERKIKECDPYIWEYKRAPEALCVTQIHYTGEHLELLDIPNVCKPVLMRDKIVLDHIKVCHEDNVKAVRQALALNQPFIINVLPKNNFYFVPDKIMVKEYVNDSSFYWSNNLISFSYWDIRPFVLGKCSEKQHVIDIDLDKETVRSLSDQRFQRLQWFGNLSWMTLVAFIIYKMRNNILFIGNLLIN